MTSPVAPPDSGRGSVASFGPRLLAFLIDGIVADLVAIVINGGAHANSRENLSSYLAFLAIEFIFVSAFGQTPGMRALGIGVVRMSDKGRPKPQWVLLRTALLATILPAVLADRSGRAMHDRASGTVMLHTR